MRDHETGKRSLFGPPPAGPQKTDDDTRRILFSGRPTVTIECARCEVSSRIGTRDALVRLAKFSLWVPGRTYSRRLVCPSCKRRSWTRLRFL
jgi:hypothetical protein